jgi:hypothetical protein
MTCIGISLLAALSIAAFISFGFDMSSFEIITVNIIGIYFLIRNQLISEFTSEVVLESVDEYSLLSIQEVMLLKFWIYPLSKFRPKRIY